MIDYALKKERLILKVESQTMEYSRINQIVTGLPVYVQDKLDREEIHDTTDKYVRAVRFSFEKIVSEKTNKQPRKRPVKQSKKSRNIYK